MYFGCAKMLMLQHMCVCVCVCVFLRVRTRVRARASFNFYSGFEHNDPPAFPQAVPNMSVIDAPMEHGQGNAGQSKRGISTLPTENLLEDTDGLRRPP